MIKTIIRKATRFFFVPFAYNSRLYFKVKDIYYTNSSEYLFRFLKLSAERVRQRENIIVDIGAADGLTTLFFKRKIKKSKVYAFEPNPQMQQLLAKNLDNQRDIVLKKIALSDRKGTSDFFVTANNLSSSLLSINDDQLQKQPLTFQHLLKSVERTEIITSTLDDELASEQNILCIKIDVQGFEMNVLKGGVKTLNKTQFVLIEMNNHEMYNEGCQYYEVDSFLRAHHFKLADILVSYRTSNRVLEYDAIYEKVAT